MLDQFATVEGLGPVGEIRLMPELSLKILILKKVRWAGKRTGVNLTSYRVPHAAGLTKPEI